MLCRKCGAELPDGSSVCKFCGTVLSEAEDTAKDEAFDADEERRQRQIDKMTEDKQKQLSQIQQRRDSKRAKQKRNKIVIAAVGCAAAVAAAGVGVHYYNQYQKEVQESLAVSPSPAVQATTAVTSPTPAVSPSPSVSASPASDIGSWTATGNSGSGRASDRVSGTSGGGTAASGASSGTGSGTSSGGASGGNSGSGSGGASSAGTSVSAASAAASGISRNSISSQIATGGEVIEDNGNWYMTFVSGNTKYYANVNPGATTDQVRNKTYTITAVPTDVTYAGNTVYEITSMTKYDGVDYILPNSGTTLLTSADLRGMSKDDLSLARNEIYARHGRRFTTAAYQQYFETKSWYSQNPNYNYNDDNSNLNEIEIKNVEFIMDAENK